MAGPGAPAGLAARWKRHIVRQLRQRDRTQKALFLELVPACECAPGGLGDGRAGDGALGEGRFVWLLRLGPKCTSAFSPPRPWACWIDPLSVTSHLRLASFPAPSNPGSA